MVSGSDCYGTPITLEADKRRISPADVVAEHHAHHISVFKKARIEYDLYTKTDTDTHTQVTQDVFIGLAKNGYIFTDTTIQYYSETEKKFLPDRYVEGTCPVCHTPGARSDQCDSCGSPLNQGELIDPVSKISGEPVTLKESEHYFIDWPKLQPFLQEYFTATSSAHAWKEWVRKETAGWLAKGLQPRAITRDLDWGIPIPIDRLPKELQIANHEQKRIYVWFDAVIGYLSAAIEWAEHSDRWEQYWKNPKATHYYFMGKDNLIFHTLFWPGQLHGYDPDLHLPDVPSINQFLTLGDQKFSKSKGVTVDSQEMLDRFGDDAVRFYFAHIMPEFADSSFTWDDFAAKTNNVLIGTIGNFINRTLTLAQDLDFTKVGSDASPSDLQVCIDVANNARDHLAQTSFRAYIDDVMQLADWGNKHLAATTPWKLDRTQPEFAQTLLPAVSAVVTLALILQPLLPSLTEKLQKQLGTALDTWPDDIADTLKDAIGSLHITHIAPLVTRVEL